MLYIITHELKERAKIKKISRKAAKEAKWQSDFENL